MIQLQEVRRNLDIEKLVKDIGLLYALCNDDPRFKPANSRSPHKEAYLFIYKQVICVAPLAASLIEFCIQVSSPYLGFPFVFVVVIRSIVSDAKNVRTYSLTVLVCSGDHQLPVHSRK